MKVNNKNCDDRRAEVLEELRALCGAKGITRTEVAETMGTSVPYISRVLWGRKGMSDAQLRRLIGAISELAEQKQLGSHGG